MGGQHHMGEEDFVGVRIFSLFFVSLYAIPVCVVLLFGALS